MARRRTRKPPSILDDILDELGNRLFGAFDTVFDGQQDYDGQQHNHNYDQSQYQQSQPPPPPPPPLFTTDEMTLYAEVVELGFREAIKKYHPDRQGGDLQKSAQVNALRDKIRRLGGFKK